MKRTYRCVKFTEISKNNRKCLLEDIETHDMVEIDDSILSNWIENGVIIENMEYAESVQAMTLEDKCNYLCDQLRELAAILEDSTEIKVLDYTSIRSTVIDGANQGFVEAKEMYVSNQGIYKHFDGCTTVIDVDGFHKNEMGAYRDIYTALKGIASDIRVYVHGLTEPIKGVNDKEYNLDRLIEICEEDIMGLLDERIVPVVINCVTNKKGIKRTKTKVVNFKPVYEYTEDLMIDLGQIYKIAKKMAIECLE